MTIIEQGRALRAEVAKLRPDKRRRYGDALIQRILAWVEQAATEGMTEAECGHTLGVKTWRFQQWRERQTQIPRTLAGGPTTLALVPIAVEPAAPLGIRAVVTPSGYRVEGLTLSEVATLLRELA
jgi:hypothetical protein